MISNWFQVNCWLYHGEYSVSFSDQYSSMVGCTKTAKNFRSSYLVTGYQFWNRDLRVAGNFVASLFCAKLFMKLIIWSCTSASNSSKKQSSGVESSLRLLNTPESFLGANLKSCLRVSQLDVSSSKVSICVSAFLSFEDEDVDVDVAVLVLLTLLNWLRLGLPLFLFLLVASSSEISGDCCGSWFASFAELEATVSATLWLSVCFRTPLLKIFYQLLVSDSKFFFRLYPGWPL